MIYLTVLARGFCSHRTTSANVKLYYDTIEEQMLTEGIAERIEGVDGTVEYAETLRILAPERMISYDETDVSLDTTVGSKAKKLRTIRVGKSDKGQVNATKSSTHITGAGGRIDFKALPAMLVFGTGNSLREE